MTNHIEDLKDDQKDKLYCCPTCGWMGKATKMYFDSDDEYEAVFSDFCCPKCLTFMDIEDWDVIEDATD